MDATADRSETPPHEAPSGSPGQPPSRREFLGIAGLGLGTLAVGAAVGLTWRAVDGGVFATGTGPAYAAWGDLRPTEGDALGLVRAAVLAANAHNTQPWSFTVSADRIDLFADQERTIGTIDPLSRERDISLGCCLENVVQAGPSFGFATTVTLLPDPTDPNHVARIDLTSAPAGRAPLFDAITSRHTDRGAYDTARPVTGTSLAQLDAHVDAPGTRLVWMSTPQDKKTFGDLTIRATEAIIADEDQAEDDFAWYRTGWQEIQERKDGITIDASGQSPLIRSLSKIVPISRAQSDDGWLRGTRSTQVPTAAAFGAIVVRDPLDRVQRLDAGRAWQRVHLSATASGLALQPLCQVLERIDREHSSGLAPDFAPALGAILPEGHSAVMTFRIGFPTSTPRPSPRRPADEVTLAMGNRHSS